MTGITAGGGSGIIPRSFCFAIYSREKQTFFRAAFPWENRFIFENESGVKHR